MPLKLTLFKWLCDHCSHLSDDEGAAYIHERHEHTRTQSTDLDTLEQICTRMDAQLNDKHEQLAEYARISRLLYEKTSAAMRKQQSPVAIVQETISKQRPANDESTATGRNAIESKVSNNLWTDEVSGGDTTMDTIDEQAVDNTSGQNVTVNEPLAIPLAATVWGAQS